MQQSALDLRFRRRRARLIARGRHQGAPAAPQCAYALVSRHRDAVAGPPLRADRPGGYVRVQPGGGGKQYHYAASGRGENLLVNFRAAADRAQSHRGRGPDVLADHLVALQDLPERRNVTRPTGTAGTEPRLLGCDGGEFRFRQYRAYQLDSRHGSRFRARVSRRRRPR